MQRYTLLIIAVVLLLTLPSCKSEPKNSSPKYGKNPEFSAVSTYRFAIHPLHNPAKLIKSYQPLIDYLNSKLKGSQLVLESSRNYADFEKKYQARIPAILLPNPWQTLQALKAGYNVIAMAGESQDFKGLFIVRKDSRITQPSDLKSKKVSYPAPTALAACIMPQYFLYTHGINISRDITNLYVGSQESSIENVFLKETAAGATWPPPWREYQKNYPENADNLKIAWETESLINNSVMIRNDLPTEFSKQIQKELIALQKTTQGRAILSGIETAHFTPATDKDYDVVRSFIERFEQRVRKVETP